MTDLLKLAIEAHGGLDRWSKVTRIEAQASIGGAVWASKGQRGILDDVRVRADPRTQWLEYSPFGEGNAYGRFEPDEVSLLDSAGQLIRGRLAPANAFIGTTRESPWDTLDTLYFAGYALWNYLTIPFLFMEPGFTVREIDPWPEAGEIWRRLEVSFPANLATHSPVQHFYFDEKGLLRRHDYSAKVLGGVPAANYALDHVTVDGIVFPTSRKVYVRDAGNRPMLDRLAVDIRLREIRVL